MRIGRDMRNINGVLFRCETKCSFFERIIPFEELKLLPKFSVVTEIGTQVCQRAGGWFPVIFADKIRQTEGERLLFHVIEAEVIPRRLAVAAECVLLAFHVEAKLGFALGFNFPNRGAFKVFVDFNRLERGLSDGGTQKAGEEKGWEKAHRTGRGWLSLGLIQAICRYEWSRDFCQHAALL